MDCCSQICCAGCLNEWGEERDSQTPRREVLDCPNCLADIQTIRPALAAREIREQLQPYLTQHPDMGNVCFEPTSPELSRLCAGMLAKATKDALIQAGWTASGPSGRQRPRTIRPIPQQYRTPSGTALVYDIRNDHELRTIMRDAAMLMHEEAFEPMLRQELDEGLASSLRGQRDHPIEISD